MLILPPGHAQTVREARAVRPSERRTIGGVLGLLAAVAVVLLISLATGGHKSGHGCISVGLASSTGGVQLYRCGAPARALCSSVDQPGGTSGGAARSIRAQCRKAGLPVG